MRQSCKRTDMSLNIERVGYALGARITGIDLSAPLASNAVAAIKEAWAEHLVLIFPNQNLTPPALIDFSSNFGELDDYASQPFNRHPEYDQIMLLSNRPINGKIPPASNGGQNWHTDLSYTIRPAKGTTLFCIERPSVGGDTMFANMYMAYEALSPRLRAILDELECVHDVSLITAKRAPEIVAEFRRLNPPVVHPAVRTHPETGRKALYVNDRVRSFVGMSEAESKPLIKYLCDFATTPRFVYRHVWGTGDVVMWDNRCLIHLAVGDFDPTEIRQMIRTSTKGDYVGRLEDPAASVASPAMRPTSVDVAAGVSALHD